MNWKSFLLGVTVGVVSGLATKELLSQKSLISPEKALAQAKTAFKEIGPISGSWIHMKTETYEKNQLKYNVYKGGISRNVDGQIEQYEFVTDANNGTILDVYKVS